MEVVVVSVVVDTLEVEARRAEAASAERAFQVEFRTLLVQDRASLHLGVHHIGSLSIPDELAERWLRLFAQQQRLVGRRIVSAHLGQLHNAD